VSLCRRLHPRTASNSYDIIIIIIIGRSALNPLESRGNYSATSNNMKLVHWPLMGGLLHLVHRGGDWLNVTAHPSTASVPITVLLYNGPLLCGFNVGIKGSRKRRSLAHGAALAENLLGG